MLRPMIVLEGGLGDANVRKPRAHAFMMRGDKVVKRGEG